MLRLSLLALSLTLALPAAAQVYQWRDAQGRINYSDTPPPSGAAKTVKPASRPKAPAAEEAAADESGEAAPQSQAADGASGEAGKQAKEKADPSKPKTMAEKEAEFRQRKVAAAEAEAKAEKDRQRTAEVARYCDQARSQIAGLKNSRRVSRFNSEGQRELMDDAARTAEIERSQRYIDENCK